MLLGAARLQCLFRPKFTGCQQQQFRESFLQAAVKLYIQDTQPERQQQQQWWSNQVLGCSWCIPLVCQPLCTITTHLHPPVFCCWSFKSRTEPVTRATLRMWFINTESTLITHYNITLIVYFAPVKITWYFCASPYYLTWKYCIINIVTNIFKHWL